MTPQIKARVLWDMVASEPRKFVLSLLPHVLDLNPTGIKELLQDTFPIGTIFETLQVVKVDPEHGLVMQVQDGIRGFVHVSFFSFLILYVFRALQSKDPTCFR